MTRRTQHLLLTAVFFTALALTLSLFLFSIASFSRAQTNPLTLSLVQARSTPGEELVRTNSLMLERVVFGKMKRSAGAPPLVSPTTMPPGASGEPLGSLASLGAGDLLQFTSGGHVIGFGSGSVYVAGLDRILRVEFTGGRPVQPVSEGEGMTSHGTLSLGTVTYANVWDGVDVVYRTSSHGIMESFYYLENTVEGPSADGIRLRYNRPVTLDGQGNLVTTFENGNMVESAPVAWQKVDGEKRFVDAAFVLHGEQVSKVL